MRAALVAAALIPTLSLAQELEPRAYSNAPAGTNFAILGYTRLSGPVLPSPAIVAVDIDARVNVYTLGYARFTELFGRSANFAIVLPYVEADIAGSVMETSGSIHRAGIGDLHLRGALNLFGHPALTPAEFAKRGDAFSGGVSLNVVAPTGRYDSQKFINIGTNRWAFKPDAGFSLPLGKWFTEAAAGVWVFTDNDDFFGGHRKSQERLAVYQLHAGYNFRPGLWLAADYGRYIGGRSSIDGVPKDDEQHNSRVGLALSVPVAKGWSAKLAVSKGTVVRVGGDYRIASLVVQYRWFD
jgi:hypothetical protein